MYPEAFKKRRVLRTHPRRFRRGGLSLISSGNYHVETWPHCGDTSNMRAKLSQFGVSMEQNLRKNENPQNHQKCVPELSRVCF